MTILVGAGSEPPMSLNMLANTGTTSVMSATAQAAAKSSDLTACKAEPRV